VSTPRPILLAVRAAISSAIVTAPAMVATGVGIAQGQPAVPVARCQHGQEVALCAPHTQTKAPELDGEELTLPPPPPASPPPMPPGRGLTYAMEQPEAAYWRSHAAVWSSLPQFRNAALLDLPRTATVATVEG
jgi:hypothetical protein